MPPDTSPEAKVVTRLGFAGLGRMGRLMAENCAHAGFRVKDITLALELDRQLDVSMPQTRTTGAILNEAIESSYTDRDMASILAFTQEYSK